MRASLPVVLAALLVNDVLLVAVLETKVEPFGMVLIVALAVTVPVAVLAGVASRNSQPPSRAELDEKFRESRAVLTRLEQRVDDLEN